MRFITIIFFFLFLDQARALAASAPEFSSLNELEYTREALKWEPHNRLVMTRLGVLRQIEQQKPSDKASQALLDAGRALKFLDTGKIAEGSALLQKVIFQVDTLSAVFPDKRELIVRSDISGAESMTTISQATPVAGQIKAAVNRGDFQRARSLLNNFENELRITRYSMPLEEFSQRLKKAQQLLAEKKTSESITAIQSALGNLEESGTVIALPLLRANVYLGEVISQDHDGKMNAREAQDLIRMADEQVRLAGFLGYAEKQEVPVLRAGLKKVSADIERKKVDRAALTKLANDMRPARRF